MNSDDSLLTPAVLLWLAGIAETLAWRRRRSADRQWMDRAVKTEGVVTRIDERESYSAMSETNFRHSTALVATVRYRLALAAKALWS